MPDHKPDIRAIKLVDAEPSKPLHGIALLRQVVEDLEAKGKYERPTFTLIEGGGDG